MFSIPFARPVSGALIGLINANRQQRNLRESDGLNLSEAIIYMEATGRRRNITRRGRWKRVLETEGVLQSSYTPVAPDPTIAGVSEIAPDGCVAIAHRDSHQRYEGVGLYSMFWAYRFQAL